MIKFKLKVSGMQRALSSIRAFKNAIQDHESIHRQLTQRFMLLHMIRQFNSSGSHGGAAWAPLTGRYRALRLALTGNERPLEWDGRRERLKPSLTQARHPLHQFNTRPNGASFGTNVPYAERLNEGGIDFFGDRFPARDIIALTQQQRRTYVRQLGQAVAQQAYSNIRGR